MAKTLDTALSEPELRHLLDILAALPRAVRHDLSQAFNTAVVNAELMRDAISAIREAAGSHAEAKLEERLRLLERYSASMAEAGERYSLLLRFYMNSFERYFEHTPFAARPFEIVAAIQEIRKAAIPVTRRSPRSLEILYPASALKALFWELIENSHRHAGAKPEIRVAWKMEQNRFIAEVHDNGPNPTAVKGYVGIEESRIGTGHTTFAREEAQGGLSILSRIMWVSGGELLFGRSRLLGGTVAKFGFPVTRYQQKGVGRTGR